MIVFHWSWYFIHFGDWARFHKMVWLWQVATVKTSLALFLTLKAVIKPRKGHDELGHLISFLSFWLRGSNFTTKVIRWLINRFLGNISKKSFRPLGCGLRPKKAKKAMYLIKIHFDPRFYFKVFGISPVRATDSGDWKKVSAPDLSPAFSWPRRSSKAMY